MADAISIQELIDARTDAKSLEEVVNGNDAKQVTTRLGESYPSVKKAIAQIFENGGLPATPFATKALMTASELVDGDYAYVTDDTVNNGLYLKKAGTWSLSDYNYLKVAKNAAIETIVGSNFEVLGVSANLFNTVNSTPNVFISGAELGALLPAVDGGSVTDFIRVANNADYTLSGGVGDNKPFKHIAFFDKDKVFINRIDATATATKPQTFTTASNVGYIRLGVSGETVDNRMMNKGKVALSYEPYFLPKLLDTDLTDDTITRIAQRSKEIGAVYDFSGKHLQIPNNLYDYRTATKGYFISGVDGSVGENSSYSLSDYIEIKPSESFLFTGGSQNSYAFIHTAFFDEDKNFLTRRSTGAYGDSSMRVTAPANAHYMRVNMQGGEPDSFERMIVRGFTKLPYDDGAIKLKDIELDDEILNHVSDYLGADNNGRFGDSLAFTADKYPAVLFDFTDSYSKDDARKVVDGTAGRIKNEDIDTWYDGLVATYPDYVTKTFVGNDSSGTYPVNSYKFAPKAPYNLAGGLKDQVRPRVFLMAQHSEQMNHIYPYLMLRELCEKWQSNPALAAIRNQVEIVVIPNAHPWGIANNQYRTTSEGLNVNSDYPFNWEKGVHGLPNGDTPFATAEARNVRDVVESFKPHVFLDMHSNFANATGSGAWIPLATTGRYKTAALNAITDIYGALTVADPDTPDLDKLIRFTYAEYNSTASGYSYMVKAVGGTVEFAKNYKGRPYDDGIYNDGLIFASSSLLNIIIQCIADYRDYGYPYREGYGDNWYDLQTP